MKETEVTKMAYKLTYHRHLMNRDKAQNLFTELSPAEYIALHSIAQVNSQEEKTYLSELAAQLDMPIPSVSKMVARLKERGLVTWSHSGDGSEGTYVIITRSGIQAMEHQEKLLSDYYSRVIEKFGQDNLASLLEQMEKLEEIMDGEFEDKEGSANGSESLE